MYICYMIYDIHIYIYTYTTSATSYMVMNMNTLLSLSGGRSLPPAAGGSAFAFVKGGRVAAALGAGGL